ncbi:MAG: hypothetical protein IIV74_00175, partial [Alphaproteobacteria bacterium]|nr:hypothetical protein [Alphaproteobacteria bacterium]
MGVQYNEDGTVKNPYASDAPKEEPAQILCEGNVAPDANGCCPGEIYTDLGDQGFNCCPEGGGDC